MNLIVRAENGMENENQNEFHNFCWIFDDVERCNEQNSLDSLPQKNEREALKAQFFTRENFPVPIMNNLYQIKTFSRFWSGSFFSLSKSTL